MGKKEELISGIIDIEWNMFSGVQGRGGRAPCQENPIDFKIARISSFVTWSAPTLESYLLDLEEARDSGRNLMTEKYARMEGVLPQPGDEILGLIETIVEKECRWAKEFLAKHPDMKLTRPVNSSQDTSNSISSETYSRGELATYSRETLESYYLDTLEIESEGMNRIEMIASNIVRLSADGSWIDLYKGKQESGFLKRAVNVIFRWRA